MSPDNLGIIASRVDHPLVLAVVIERAPVDLAPDLADLGESLWLLGFLFGEWRASAAC